jgi:hypothetical protein
MIPGSVGHLIELLRELPPEAPVRLKSWTRTAEVTGWCSTEFEMVVFGSLFDSPAIRGESAALPPPEQQRLEASYG